ncbi:MAG TPA: hypothetical protein VFB36_00875 [Nevskiaceae bacterium]|nr:hypothetical protein [Nevskiaceae bacterium]
MRLALLITASLLTSTSAFADSFSNSLSPQLTLGLQFGGRTSDVVPMRFTALFDVRSQLLRRDPELAHSSLATLSAGAPLLSVFELSASHKGVDLVNVLGNNMLAKDDQLNETGDTPWYGHKWIWWTAGAVLATGAALAAAGGHSDNEPTGSNGGGCTGVGTPPPGGSSVVDTSNPSQSNPSCVIGG